MENNNGDNVQPCRTPRPITAGSDSPSATLTTACCLIQITYQPSILPVHLQLFQHFHHFESVNPVKCLFKIHKAYVNIITMLQTPFAQHPHYSYCVPSSTSFPKAKLILPYKPDCF